MSAVNQQLLDYIRGEITAGVPVANIRSLLLQNDWPAEVVDQAFAELGIQSPSGSEGQVLTDGAVAGEGKFSQSLLQDNITMDKIIEKFIPIAGAIFLIVGFGYLLYDSAWVHLAMELRLTLGFFFSVVIIGGSFSLSERMRYFTDIGIGSGVLLLYATLIYGSRTTELATAMIPELATLFTSLLFTIGISYFASKRNSKVILILGMIGAYITPFVIGQNDVWVENISFNAYLMYFFAVNLSVFLIGREISVRDIVPLNTIGLFVGVSTLWGLSLSDGIKEVKADDVLTGEPFTGFLFLLLVVTSIWSILLSARLFREKDDGYLSLGYVAPVVWFAYNINGLHTLSDVTVGILYVIISASCFVGWHILIGHQTRFQHTALYASGLLSAFLAVFAFFEDFDVYTSMLIAYTSLVFGFLYIMDHTKKDRFISYVVVSFVGSVLSLHHIFEANVSYETLLVVLSLLPAMGGYFIAKGVEGQEFRPFAGLYSLVAALYALMFVLNEFLDYIDIDFLLFYLLPLIFIIRLAFINKSSADELSHESRSRTLRLALLWFAFSFVSVFFYLVGSIYPAPDDVYLFTHPEMPTDWEMIKGVFATIILFLGLKVSRQLQTEQIIKRPSFILVIFSFSTLLLSGNYIISAIMNDIGVNMEHGGPRAIATTIWWAAIAIYMLYFGIKLGKKYHAEKLLGLMLLGITLVKVILYDMYAMEMKNKIIVLMIVGGAMLVFSYVVKSKDLLQAKEE